MAVRVIKKNQQARGEFNGGEILENKPIGFPREGGHVKPYSNLFYWAHAWSDEGSTIGLHPHQGFEIMSFVTKGSIEHFDTKLNKWIKLEEGAAQIIRSGNGISHSEKLNAGAHMFQIWFDPDLSKTLEKEASYNDYPHEDFPIQENDGVTKKVYKGEGSPLKMDSPDVSIESWELKAGENNISVDESLVHSLYLVEGDLKVNEDSLEQDDFLVVYHEKSLPLHTQEGATLFVVSSPASLNYKTYAERMQLSNG